MRHGIGGKPTKFRRARWTICGHSARNQSKNAKRSMSACSVTHASVGSTTARRSAFNAESVSVARARMERSASWGIRWKEGHVRAGKGGVSTARCGAAARLASIHLLLLWVLPERARACGEVQIARQRRERRWGVVNTGRARKRGNGIGRFLTCLTACRSRAVEPVALSSRREDEEVLVSRMLRLCWRRGCGVAASLKSGSASFSATNLFGQITVTGVRWIGGRL
jgi:hypothetical protein